MVMLNVVTTRGWLVDELRAGAAPFGVEVVHDWGLGLPDNPNPDGWWMPCEHAARLLRAGIDLNLSAPGPNWLPTVPDSMLGRNIWVGTAAELAEGMFDGPMLRWIRPGFVKLAESKLDPPAQWCGYAREQGTVIMETNPPDTVVQVADKFIPFDIEWRAYVINGEVVTSSPYLVDGATWDETMMDDPFLAATPPFAREVAAEMAGRSPAAYTLDVGLAHDDWFVVEANPVWSSGTYGCDPAAVVEALLAANEPDWAWNPCPSLTAYAERVAPLR